MLGFGQISDAAICDLGGQVLSQSALATTSPLATNAHLPTKILLGSTSPLAILVRRVTKPLLATASAAASLVRALPRTLSATTSPVATLVRRTAKLLSAIGSRPVTNYLTFSQALDNAAWSTAGNAPTIVSNNEIAPDGTATAVRATISAVGGTHYAFRQAVPTPVNTNMTFGVYVKAAPTASAANVRLCSNNTGSWNTGGDAILALTSSWQRLPMTFYNEFNYSSTAVYIGSVKSDASVDPTCYGDIIVWGGMLQAGAALTDYIATTTTAVTVGPATLVKRAIKALLATTLPTAALVRRALKVCLATTAPVGSLVRQGLKPLLAMASTATLIVRRVFALRPVSIALSALLTKRTSRTFLVSIATLASYTKVRLKAFAAISWVASSSRRAIARRALSSAAVLGTLKRSTGHRILASTAPAARLVHALVRSLQASAAQTTRLVRTIGKPLKARADRAGILVKTISHHGLTLAPTLARLVRRPAKAFLSAIGVLALLRRRAGLPRASSTHPIATLVRRSLLPRVATSATAVRLVRSILVPLVRPVWAFGYAHKGLAAALRAQTAPQARVIKLLRRLVSLSIGVGAILVKRSRPRLPVAVATAAGSLVRRLGVHRLGSAIAIGNLRRTISHGLVIFVHAAGLVAKRFPRSMLAAGTVAAILRRRTAHLARVSISVLALLPKPLHIKNLLAAVRTSTIFAKLLKLIKHPLLFGLFGPPDLKATNAPPQLQADDANPNLTGKIQ